MAPLCFMKEKEKDALQEVTIFVGPDDAYPFLQNASQKA
jgi:hypothetical protein